MSIYPYFDYYPFKRKFKNRVIIGGEISTQIRKKFDGIYYLCMVRIQSESPISTLKRMGVPKNSYNNWLLNELLQKLMVDSYKIIKFGVLTHDTLNLQGNPVGFQIDSNQRTERERWAT